MLPCQSIVPSEISSIQYRKTTLVDHIRTLAVSPGASVRDREGRLFLGASTRGNNRSNCLFEEKVKTVIPLYRIEHG